MGVRFSQYASDELKNDRKVVLAAVIQNGYLYQYASDALKNDREVVLAAVNQNGHSLLHVSNELKNKNWECASVCL
jgi:hypothetical protein